MGHTIPVGGYTFSTEKHAGEERSAYWIVVIFLATSLTMIRRKMQKTIIIGRLQGEILSKHAKTKSSYFLHS